jgi:hypothetical protein
MADELTVNMNDSRALAVPLVDNPKTLQRSLSRG